MISPQAHFRSGFLAKPVAAIAMTLTLFAFVDASALAAETAPEKIEVGRSALVVNQVVGKFGETEPAPIKLDDEVLFNEDISTGKAAKTIVRFRDGSTFAMGPDAVARIDSFVFNPDESISHKTVTVTQGVFRYISGVASKDQNTEIKITSGTMSVRGSVVSGVVAPGVPPMLFVAQGNATFINAAGSSDVQAGQAIAVPSPSTPPMNPASLPPAVIAQALAVIEPLLPPPQVQSSLIQPNPQVLSSQGKLNLVPAAQQQAQQAGVPATPLLRGNSGAATLSRALTLLNQANAVGLLNGGQSSPTPQQQAFLNQVNQAANQALAQLNQVVGTATNAHNATATSAIVAVAQGLSAAGPTQTAALTPPPGAPPPGPGGTPGTGTAPSVTPAVGATPGSLGTAPTTVQAVQSAITLPGTSVTPTVLSLSEANATVSEAALRTALSVLGAGTGAAAAMITTFAQDVTNVADCDQIAGQQMAAALQAVLKDPGYSALATNAPSAVALAQTTVNSIGVTTFGPTGTPTPTNLTTASAPITGTTPGTPTPAGTNTAPTPTFGNFGSITNTGASTSPAS